MKRSSYTAVRQINDLMLLNFAMLLCVTAVNGFSVASRFRSVLSSQTQNFLVAAGQPNAGILNADPTFLESIPKSKRTAEENDKIEEEAVDEYLEFLDRRYRRLHEKESKTFSTPIKASFSALNWLTQEQVTDSILSEQIQDDALYVLGVAGLASKRLLHKHHIPVSFIKPISWDSIEVSSKALNDESGSTSQKKASGMGKIVARVTKVRQALITYQSRQFVAALKALIITPLTLMKKMWAVGGGKRTLAVTFALASVLTIALIRPLVMTIGKESLNIVGSA